MIEPLFDDQHERIYRSAFSLTDFFGGGREELRELGWKLVHQLQVDLPDAQPWSAYRVYEGNLVIQSRREKDVEANLARLAILANLESVGLNF
jgi:hypothetical protein